MWAALVRRAVGYGVAGCGTALEIGLTARSVMTSPLGLTRSRLRSALPLDPTERRRRPEPVPARSYRPSKPNRPLWSVLPSGPFRPRRFVYRHGPEGALRESAKKPCRIRQKPPPIAADSGKSPPPVPEIDLLSCAESALAAAPAHRLLPPALATGLPAGNRRAWLGNGSARRKSPGLGQ